MLQDEGRARLRHVVVIGNVFVSVLRLQRYGLFSTYTNI